MDKNLYAAQRFFKDCFGAICFYNQAADGYLTLDDIAAKRQEDFTKLFDKLFKDEWYAYLRDMNVPEFDRTIDKK